MKTFCRKIIVAILIATLAPVTSHAQSKVDAKVVSAFILTSPTGPQGLTIEFLVTSSATVSEAAFYYRPVGTTPFRRLRLKRNQLLNYAVKTDYYHAIEYFVEIVMEAGGRSQVFSALTPATLITENLPTDTRKSSKLSAGDVPFAVETQRRLS